MRSAISLALPTFRQAERKPGISYQILPTSPVFLRAREKYGWLARLSRGSPQCHERELCNKKSITWYSSSPIGRFNIPVAGPGIWSFVRAHVTGWGRDYTEVRPELPRPTLRKHGFLNFSRIWSVQFGKSLRYGLRYLPTMTQTTNNPIRKSAKEFPCRLLLGMALANGSPGLKR